MLTAAVVCLLACCAVGGANAASVGGVAATSLLASTQAAAPKPPVVVAWENFDGADGTKIASTSTDGGKKVWAAPRCTWTIASNGARSSSGDCALVINIGVVDASIEVTVARNASSAWDAGIVFGSNAAASQFLTVEYTSAANGTIELWKYNGRWTMLASTTNLYPGGVATTPDSIVLRVESPSPVAPATTSVIRVLIDATPRLSATLSAADQASYKGASQTNAGAYAYFDPTTTFDNFHVDTP